MDELALEPGARIDHYRLTRLLGRGGMGSVWLARDERLGRRVALKVIRDPEPERLLEEARMTARFSHANIVTVYAVGLAQGRAYLALEYIPGRTLRDRIRESPVSVDTAIRIAHAIASAVAAAHLEGVLHLDLKPENVLLGEDGRVRVVDFGIARHEGSPHQDEGTPRYLAPERWRGDPLEAGADVWGLGVILYELVAGGRPFADVEGDRVQLAHTVTTESAPRLSTQQVPQPYADLVHRCLATEPADRPSIPAVVDALSAMMPGRRVVGCPFPGLLAFGEQDAGAFFGRSAEVGRLAERLRTEPAIAVVGASGAGKSSLVFAGLVPRLREQASWRVLRIRPGGHPTKALDALLDALEDETSNQSTTRAASGDTPWDHTPVEPAPDTPASMQLRLLALARVTERRVLLVIDQLEEIYTLCDDPEERQAFLEVLSATADAAEDPVRMVVTIRDDFLGRLAWDRPIFVLRPPGRANLRAALNEALGAVGYHAPEVADALVDGVSGELAPLPLLQFTARLLWDQRDEARRTIPPSALDALGGVGGVLAQHADEQLADLGQTGRDAARQLLLRLVTDQGTRRSMLRERALEGLPDEAEAVLERLTEARLLVQRRGREGTQVDLAHESLLHSWNTLARWVSEAKESIRIASDLEDAAQLWDRRGRPDEALWAERALKEADLLEDQPLSDQARSFLAASRHTHARALLRRRRLRAGIVGSALLVAFAATTAAVLLGRTSARAEQAAEAAQTSEARALATSATAAWERGDALTARAQLRRALTIADSVEARALWGRVSASNRLWSRSVATTLAAVGLHPSGGWAVAVDEQGGMVRIDTRTGELTTLPSLEGAVRYMDVGPDGTVVTDNAGSRVQVVKPDGTVVQHELADEHRVLAVEMDDGGVAYAITRSGPVTTHLWRIPPEGEPTVADLPEAQNLIDSAGPYLITGSRRPGELTRWTVAADGSLSGERVTAITTEMRTRKIAVSSNGVAALVGREVVAWDLSADAELYRHEGIDLTQWADVDDDGRVRAINDDGQLHSWTGAGHRSQRLVPTHEFAEAKVVGDRMLLSRPKQVEWLRLDREPPVPLTERDATSALGFRDDLLVSGGWEGQLVGRQLSSPLPAWSNQTIHGAYVGKVEAGGGWVGTAANDGAALFRPPGVGLIDLPHRVDVVDIHILGPDRVLTLDWGGGLHLWRVDLSRTASSQLLQTVGFSSNPVSMDVLGNHVFAVTIDGLVWSTTVDERMTPLKQVRDTGQTAYFIAASAEEQVVYNVPGAITRLEPNEVLTTSGGEYGPFASALHDGVLAIAWLEPEANEVIVARGSERIRLPALDPRVDAMAMHPERPLLATSLPGGAVRLWHIDEGRPIWRGGYVDAEGRVSSGDEWIGGPDQGPPEQSWRTALTAAITFDAWDDHLCLLGGSEVTLWSRGEDRPLASVEATVRDLSDLAATGAGCQVGDRHLELDGQVTQGPRRLASRSGPFTLEDGRLTRGDFQSGPLLVPPTRILETDTLYVGDERGRVSVIGPDAVDSTEIAGGMGVTVLEAGPDGLLVVGFRDGVFGLYDPRSGSALRTGRLEGPVTMARRLGDQVILGSSLGDRGILDLGALEADYCDLLTEVASAIPVTWVDGAVDVADSPPSCEAQAAL